MDAFIQSLPKTETHLHIEGALPYELLHAWQPEQYPENPYFHAPEFRYPTFPKFDEISRFLRVCYAGRRWFSLYARVRRGNV